MRKIKFLQKEFILASVEEHDPSWQSSKQQARALDREAERLHLQPQS